MEKLSVNWWKTSASSADINPIERVWAKLKSYIAGRVKPLSKRDLVSGIVVFWSRRITQDKCIKYIRHVNKVLPKSMSSSRSGVHIIDDLGVSNVLGVVMNGGEYGRNAPGT